MSLDVIARLNGVTFRSREPETGSVEGFYIDDEGFEGWTDGTEILRDVVNRAQAHGAFDVPGYLDARVVSITGTCWADTPEKLTWFGSQITGLLAEGSGTIVVEQPGSTQWANGRLAARTVFAVRAEDIRSATYQLQLWCANPRKFGESRTFASGAAYHYGNFTAAPVLTVTGSAPSGYTINGPAGKQYVVSRALVTGTPHVIDMADGYLKDGGVIVSGGVSRADTWGIPGGGSVAVTVTPVSGSAAVSQLVTDTFI